MATGAELLVRISAPHFVADVVVGQQAPPVVCFMRRWTLPQIQSFAARRGWTVECQPTGRVANCHGDIPVAPTAPAGQAGMGSASFRAVPGA